MAMRSKSVFDRSIAGIADSNPTEDMKVVSCVCCVLCTYRPLRQADHSLRRVLPTVCVSNCVRSTNLKTRRPALDLGYCVTEEKIR
jgi:hypothetical protein